MTVKIKRSRKPVSERFEQIKTVLGGGERSLKALCKQLGLKPSTLHLLCKKNSIQLPEDIKPWGVWPDVDRCIKKGYLLREMKEYLKENSGESPTTQRLSSYIAETHQERLWMEKKQKRKDGENSSLRSLTAENVQMREYIAALLLIVKGHVFAEAASSPWAERKAVEYSLSVRPCYSGHKLDTLVKLFSVYADAKNRCERLTLEELGDKVKLHFVSVGKILQRVHVEPMYGAHPRLSKEDRQKVVGALEARFSGADIAYFSDIPLEFVGAVYRSKVKHNDKTYPCFSESNGHIPLRVASEVYEAHDLGFTLPEIASLVDEKESVVNHALRQRESIEQKIYSIKELFSLGDKNKK